MKTQLFLVLIFLSVKSSCEEILIQKNDDHVRFGGFAISKELFDYIRTILPVNKKILELGSGWGTSQLSKYYKVYSIEHNKNWINKYKSTYIYAPIKNKWYDVDILKKKLPQQYDLILVDGPTGCIGRYGFFINLHIFKTNIPIIFDDTNRANEYKLIQDVAKKLNKPFKIFNHGKYKTFGVIL